jgi:hypothetical protein
LRQDSGKCFIAERQGARSSSKDEEEEDDDVSFTKKKKKKGQAGHQ